MGSLALLVMAAGMGSRYGGLKQLDQVGPSGETIIDYSVYDAIKAGFTKVVFIIRKDFEDQFKSEVSSKYSKRIDVEFAFQEVSNLPSGFTSPDGREKPWGTGHAILSAKELIREPFVVINGDDFYGRESFNVIADYYITGGNQFSMVAFRLDKTLSAHGAVTRGVCSTEKEKLNSIIETEDIEEKDNIILSNRDISFDGGEPVSMNMWGFTPSLFTYLSKGFVDFLNAEGNELKSEYLIPSIINNLIQNELENVHVLRSNASWFGVTYKNDKPVVKRKINELIKSSIYPSHLFE